MQLLTAGSGPVIGLAFSLDSQALAATCVFGLPWLWELPATGKPIRLTQRYATAHSFTFSAGSAIVGWLDTHVRYEFDRHTGDTEKNYLTRSGELIEAQTLCGPDGRLLLRTRKTPEAPCIKAFKPDNVGSWIEAWTIGPSETLYGGTFAIAGSGGERFYTWETPSFGKIGAQQLVVRSSLTGDAIALCNPANSLTCLVATPDGSAVVGFQDSSLYFWRPGEKVEKVRTGTRRHYRDLAFHPDGRHLLAGNNDTTARLFDTHTWQVVRQFTWDVGALTKVAISPDGMLAAAGGTNGSVVVWDVDL